MAADIRKGLTLATVLCAMAAFPVAAREIYVVRAFTPAARFEGCTYLYWTDDLRFLNTTSRDLTVRLLGVSNGGPRSEQRELLVPAGEFRSPRDLSIDWAPVGAGATTAFWVNHLEIPDGLEVSSRAQPTAGCGPPCFPCLDGRVFGSIALPVFGALTEPNRPRYLLRTDLGTDGSLTAPSRVNVGIYNAGSATATATIELRRECDRGLVARGVHDIPADTFIQIPAFGNDTRGQRCTGGLRWATYVVVTVDQPSFAYAATLSYDLPPMIPVSISAPNN